MNGKSSWLTRWALPLLFRSNTNQCDLNQFSAVPVVSVEYEDSCGVTAHSTLSVGTKQDLTITAWSPLALLVTSPLPPSLPQWSLVINNDLNHGTTKTFCTEFP